MKWIDDLKVELKCEKASLNIELSQNILDLSKISHERTKLLNPLVVRSKGCPPFKRKESIVDQILKKLREKRQQSFEKDKNYGRKEKVISKSYLIYLNKLHLYIFIYLIINP